jgi:tRNA (guanine-N7-)-methyltransferase
MRLRGRKGIREDIEQQKDLIILNPSEHLNNWSDVFGNDNPIHIELGMGKGRFISHMSLSNPNINFMGIDMYDELVRKAAEKARAAHIPQNENLEIKNLKLILMNIENLENVFSQNEVERIYLNFSDPWPKKKHAPRRLTHQKFLEKYVHILNRSGEIHFKTDSSDLFEFSLNSFSDFGLQMKNITFNLHAEGTHHHSILTEYEMKFISQGMKIYRCEVMVGKHKEIPEVNHVHH